MRALLELLILEGGGVIFYYTGFQKKTARGTSYYYASTPPQLPKASQQQPSFKMLKFFVIYMTMAVCQCWITSYSNIRSIGTKKSFVVMKDYPKPSRLENTQNFRDAGALSAKFKELKGKGSPKKVAIIGGGLSGLAAARYLVDAGHIPTVYEARDVLGGKVSAWQDKDGDWIETGLHIFFGAYPNMMNLFKELGIEDRLQWKIHQMIFAMQELPGEFTTFDFIPGIPAPFNFGLAILSNQKMLTLWEKLQTAPPLIPMLVEGQPFIDAQDELSVTDFMRKYGMNFRISINTVELN